VIDLASTYKIIDKSGSWFEWEAAPGGKIRAQGMDGMIKLVTEQKGALKALFAQVVPKLTAVQKLDPTTIEDEADGEEIAEDLFDDIVPLSKAETAKRAAASGEETPAAFMTEIESESD
jgi:hypothetical protein